MLFICPTHFSARIATVEIVWLEINYILCFSTAEPDTINKGDASEEGQRKNKLYPELNSSWHVRQEQEQYPQMRAFSPCVILKDEQPEVDSAECGISLLIEDKLEIAAFKNYIFLFHFPLNITLQ